MPAPRHLFCSSINRGVTKAPNSSKNTDIGLAIDAEETGEWIMVIKNYKVIHLEIFSQVTWPFLHTLEWKVQCTGKHFFL